MCTEVVELAFLVCFTLLNINSWDKERAEVEVDELLVTVWYLMLGPSCIKFTRASNCIVGLSDSTQKCILLHYLYPYYASPVMYCLNQNIYYNWESCIGFISLVSIIVCHIWPENINPLLKTIIQNLFLVSVNPVFCQHFDIVMK